MPSIALTLKIRPLQGLILAGPLAIEAVLKMKILIEPVSEDFGIRASLFLSMALAGWSDPACDRIQEEVVPAFMELVRKDLQSFFQRIITL
jgi:hypothetical protein